MHGITPAQSNCALTAMLQPGAAKRIRYLPRMGMALFAPNAWPRICQITPEISRRRSALIDLLCDCNEKQGNKK
jgi:hypothetical protein